MPPRVNGRVQSPATMALIELVRRPEGATPAEAVEVLKRHGLCADLNLGAERLRKLTLSGHAVRFVQKNGRVRYFRNDAAMQAWARSDSAQSARPSPAMDGIDIDAVYRKQGSQPAQQLAAMVEAAAPAVERAMAVIAPAPSPAAAAASVAPRASTGWYAKQAAAATDEAHPKPYIPPTPTAAQRPPGSEAASAKRAAEAGIPRPTGEPIVPPDVKRTVANAPAYDLRFGVDPKAVSADPESFSAQWKRLRGEGTNA